jgi:hypothetical protein
MHPAIFTDASLQVYVMSDGNISFGGRNYLGWIVFRLNFEVAK